MEEKDIERFNILNNQAIYLNYNRLMQFDYLGIYLYNKPNIDYTYYCDYESTR